MDAPIRLDGTEKGPVVRRKIVVWRRLEPGDVRTPGTEIAPESPHIEAKVIQIAIAKKTFEELERLWKKRDEVTAVAAQWTTRYEPAGVLFAIGGSGMIAVGLDYLPPALFWVCASFTGLGAAVGLLTRARKAKADGEATAAWNRTEERRALDQLEKTLTPRWKRFSQKLLEKEGFRTDVRVGDVHDADRLVSIDADRITHPDTWRADEKRREVRYGWVFSDGRYAEQVAELEETDVPLVSPFEAEAKAEADAGSREE
ncbi:MAG: hypothetical protein KC586_13120, partial [Myxococcales bacterium]|nr:hypothetical protein [Myxococcales bacterium]